MARLAICLILYLFAFSDLPGQQLVLIVRDGEQQPLFPAVITFRDRRDTLKIKEFVSTNSGRTTYTLTKAYDGILVTVASLGYETQRIRLDQPEDNRTYTLTFDLPPTPADLQQVLVRATRKPYRERQDTVTYNVAAYADDGDRKIEDVIKRMPGITVNDNSGEIRYQGKPVQTVNLNGDNLFDRNYAIGTRNLNADAIREVEAIDNYNENPVLSGLAADGKVALNLVLKDRVFDVSGSADLGLGVQAGPGPALDVGGTLLGIGKKIKSFAAASYNNVGNRRSPYDPFSMDLLLRPEEREDFAAIQPVQGMGPISIMGNRQRTHRNQELFASLVGLVKWTPKLTTRLRLTPMRDVLLTNTLYRNDYFFGNDALVTSDATDAESVPRIFNANLRLLYDASLRSRLEYQLDVTGTATNTGVNVLRNQTDDLRTDLLTGVNRLSHFLLWTKRISDTKALEVKAKHTEQVIRQSYSIIPSIGGGEGADEQWVDNTARAVRIEASLIGRWGSTKYTHGLAWRSLYMRLGTELREDELLLAQNDLAYSNHSLALRGSTQLRWKRFRITPSYELLFLKRSLNDRANERQLQRSDLLPRPRLNVRYDFNRNNFLRTTYAYHPVGQLEDHLYTEGLLVNQRTIVNHDPSLRLRQEQTLAINYFHNNLRHGYEVTVGGTYQIDAGNFFPDLCIGPLLTRMRFVYAPLTNTAATGTGKVSKYLPSLRTTVIYNGQVSRRKYRNLLEGTSFRLNTSNQIINKLSLQISPKVPFKVFQSVSVDYSRARSPAAPVVTNTSLITTTRVTSTAIKRVFVSAAMERIHPDLSNGAEAIVFFDASFRYRPKNKPWSLTGSLMNLTNVREFRQRTVSDIATTVSSVRLLPRQVVIRLSRNF